MVAVLVAAAWALSRQLGGLHPRDVVRALEAMPLPAVWAAIGLTAVSYGVLTLYDALSLRHIGQPLPYRRSAMAAFMGYAISQNVGLSVVSGAPIRFRLYTAWGLSAVDVAAVVAFNGVTYWLGLMATSGMALLIGGLELTAGLLPISGLAVRLLGVVALAVVAAYVMTCAIRTEPLRVGSWAIALPRPATALIQIGLGIIDWLVAASVLWVLVRWHAPVGFTHLVAVFVLAQLVGVLSQVPGGLGVFETAVLALLPDAVTPGAGVAMLLAYRIVYYLLPLLAAVLLLLTSELWERRQGLGVSMRWAGGWIGMVAPRLLAVACAVAGGLLVMTGSLPALSARLRWLEGLVPLAAVEASHLLGSVIGTLLVVLAWGLDRRLRAAWWLASVGLAVGVVASIGRGTHDSVTVTSLLTLIALLPARQVFSRRTALLSEPLSVRWVVAVAMVVGGSVWVGLVAYRDVAYTSDLWWRFSLHGDAPRFLRASVAAAAVLLVLGAWRLMSPGRPRHAPPATEVLAVAERLVASSPRASAHLGLLGDKRLLLSDAGDAFLMYGVRGASWIAMGDPVGEPASATELIWRFRAMSDRWAGRTVFYEVGEEHLGTYLELGLATFKIGEEAFVPLADFTLEGSRRKDLRHVVRRAEREGGTFAILEPGAVAARIGELRAVSDEWLAAKGTREKRFSLGWFDEVTLARQPVAVVEVAGRVVAFANLWAGAQGGELSVDLMRFTGDAPHGAMDYLFVQLMLWGAERGWTRFGLGMAPLAGVRAGPLTPAWNRLAETVWRFGGSFYNFQGLRQYKDKFGPEWEPRYLVCPGGASIPGVLADLAALVSGGWKADA